jgi:hypothetical protein
METINQWMIRVFWMGFARWAATPGNDERAATFAAYMIENMIAASEASQTAP